MMLVSMLRRAQILSLFLVSVAAALAADDPLAEAVDGKHCAQCHDQGGASRIPTLAALHQFTSAPVNRALLGRDDRCRRESSGDRGRGGLPGNVLLAFGLE